MPADYQQSASFLRTEYGEFSEARIDQNLYDALTYSVRPRGS